MKSKYGYKKIKWFFGKEIEIPKEWNCPKFSSIIKINPITKISSKIVPYVPMDAVDTDRPSINYFEERKHKNNSNLPKFQDNDVLFARITPSTENGKTALIENFIDNGIASSELIVLRPSRNILPRYLYYYVKSPRIRQFAISQMMGSTGRQRVPDSVFKKDLYIELPLFVEQTKIASILSGVDATIEATQKVIEKTERLKVGLMQQLLTRGINHKKCKKAKWYFGKEIEIPKEWNFTKLEKITKVTDGAHYSPPKVVNGFPLATVENVKANAIDIDSCYQISKEDYEYLVKSGNKPNVGDVLFTKDGTVGKTLVFRQGNLILLSSIAIIQKSEKLDSDYCNYALQSRFMIKHLSRYLGGTAIKRIIVRHLAKYEFPIPPLAEQIQIASILSGVDAYIQKNHEYKKKLEELKRGLMQKLLTGQLRVKI